MTRVRIVVREVGRKKPDYSLDFDLPEIPKIGSYISIRRPDTPEGYDDEDLIVRQVGGGWTIPRLEPSPAPTLKLEASERFWLNAIRRLALGRATVGVS